MEGPSGPSKEGSMGENDRSIHVRVDRQQYRRARANFPDHGELAATIRAFVRVCANNPALVRDIIKVEEPWQATKSS